MQEPLISVGIMYEPEIHIVFHGNYLLNNTNLDGKSSLSYSNGLIEWEGQQYTELFFEPSDNDNCFFELVDVTIGIDFHWQRKENQSFRGALKVIIENGKLTAINILPIEEYLLSVISSEMSATASLSLLKAHAVISRSWLLAQIRKQKKIDSSQYTSSTVTEDELIRWYDREDHLHFDVCADDHCQRYQGINRATNNKVIQAIEATKGHVLMYDNSICDTRFSKCCGGMLEEFQYCWENIPHPYLQKRRDSKTDIEIPDLRYGPEARQWIRSSPDAFCNTKDKHILGQVLNNYDQETTDFYRWKVIYSQEELSLLVKRRIGIDFGTVHQLIPLERGTSGRIVRLKIVGSHRTMILGKELMIRRALSESHLYSSAFVVDKVEDNFVLTGAGWGHGVGLCQIGAAVMGEQGRLYDEILLHYYIGAIIKKLY